MRAKRVDNNQADVVKALERCGVQVFDTSGMGFGFPDLVLGFRGKTYLAEVKNGDTAWTFTPAQKRFHAEWNGDRPLIFTSVDDVALWIKRSASHTTAAV